MTDDSGRHTLDTYDHASQRTCIVGIHARSQLVTLVVVSRRKKKNREAEFQNALLIINRPY